MGCLTEVPTEKLAEKHLQAQPTRQSLFARVVYGGSQHQHYWNRKHQKFKPMTMMSKLGSIRNSTTVLLRRALLRSTTATPIRNTVAPLAFPIHSETPIRSNYGWVSHYTSSSAGIDLSNEESKRSLFNRLLYRSRQRGFLELDLVLGNWVEEHIHSLDENGIISLVHVLDLENPDLWKWLTGQEQPPEAVDTNPVFSAVRDKVMNNLNTHASPETRAIPGQPWVRGWDDFKKGRDSPISGNQ